LVGDRVGGVFHPPTLKAAVTALGSTEPPALQYNIYILIF
jgi:hypothetical protein